MLHDILNDLTYAAVDIKFLDMTVMVHFFSPYCYEIFSDKKGNVA
jgi:hypothetical protein